jgi:hypothetical protein
MICRKGKPVSSELPVNRGQEVNHYRGLSRRKIRVPKRKASVPHPDSNSLATLRHCENPYLEQITQRRKDAEERRAVIIMR